MGNFNNYINRICNQKAVYWEYEGNDGFGGSTYKDPIVIDCRWVRRREVIKTLAGNEIVSDTHVLIKQDLKEESMLFEGTLDDLSSDQEADPSQVEKAYKMNKFHKVPNLKADTFVRRAYLTA